MLDQPLQCDIYIILFFARNGVATDFSILDSSQVHFFYELLLIQSVRKVPLVSKYKDRNALELGLVQKIVQLVPRRFYLFTVCRINHIHYSINSSAVPLPHAPKSRLSADVPDLYCYIAFGDFSHVEADGWYHVLTELT